MTSWAAPSRRWRVCHGAGLLRIDRRIRTGEGFAAGLFATADAARHPAAGPVTPA